jgi:hypothetical protein
MLSHLTCLVDALDARIAGEAERIEKGIANARAQGTAMHKDYWTRLYALREHRRAALILIDAITEAVAP